MRTSMFINYMPFLSVDNNYIIIKKSYSSKYVTQCDN